MVVRAALIIADSYLMTTLVHEKSDTDTDNKRDFNTSKTNAEMNSSGFGDSDGNKKSSRKLNDDMYDWIFVSGDDTYLLVDSLRAYLRSTAIQSLGSNPLFLGQTWSWNRGLVYTHGGGGYVLNR